MKLFTRMDFDGLVCAAMMYEMERIDEIQFCNPKDIEEERVFTDLGDFFVHLPFHRDAGVWFHNHDDNVNPALLERTRGKWGKAPSTAGQVYKYYDDERLKKFIPLVDVADKIGGATLSEDDILNPSGYVLLSYTLDPRWAQDHAYGIRILDKLRLGKPVDEILNDSMVQARVQRYLADEAKFADELKQHTKVGGNVILTDFREYEDPPRGNRFRVFLMAKEANVHVLVTQHRDPMKLLVSVSRSIFNRSSKVHIGQLMEKYSGGGHERAGTCPIAERTADERLKEIIAALKE